jgi:hypothetical protein
VIFEIAISGGVGFVVGVVAAGLFMWRKVRMFRLLWENERAGNFLMVRRLSALEAERLKD